jgi:hypothetical protein
VKTLTGNKHFNNSAPRGIRRACRTRRNTVCTMRDRHDIVKRHNVLINDDTL